MALRIDCQMTPCPRVRPSQDQVTPPWGAVRNDGGNASSEKIAIVTGAGSGIGKASALALVRDGWSVVFAGRRVNALEAATRDAAANEGTAAGARVLLVPTDVRDPASVKALFSTTIETFGRLDLLFNNAGSFSPPKLLQDLTYEQWTAVVDTNLTGTFLCTQEAFRIMKQQQPRGGRIINNGSISAHTPRPNSAPYTATKHAVTGLTKSTSLDGRKYDIACGQIDIGNAQTEGTARMKSGCQCAVHDGHGDEDAVRRAGMKLQGHSSTDIMAPQGVAAMHEVRARIGLIIPSGNQLTEPQFQRYAPPDIQVHVTRMRMTGPHHAPLPELMPRIIESAHCLADAKCDGIVFHCTAASMAPGAAAGPRVDEVVREATGCQATTTADAVLAAFQALDVRKVVMHSPYNQATHDEEAAFLEQAGIRILGGRALGLRPPVTTAARWLDITLEEANPGADAYFLSCTNIHSLSVLDEIEQRLQRPAIASNQATLWHCLRLCGIDAPVPGLGRLLSAAEPVSTHT